MDLLGSSRERGRDSDFQNLHRNKRALSLDLKQEEGRALLLRLVDGADVLVENMRPPVKHRLGFDFATVHARNPRLVLRLDLGLRPGRTVRGARRRRPDRAGHGRADERDRHARHAADACRHSGVGLAAGLYLAVGILAALHERARTGEGRWVTTSLLEAMIAMMDLQAARWTIDGVVPAQEGNHHPTLVPMGCFETQDGYVNIAGPTGRLLRNFCKAVGLPELPDRPALRLAREPQPQPRRAERARRRAVAHAHDRGVGRGAERGRRAVRPGLQAWTRCSPTRRCKHLAMAAPVEHPALGRLELVRNAARMSGVGASVRTPTPEAGEHADAILAELGLTHAEIADLRRRNVV